VSTKERNGDNEDKLVLNNEKVKTSGFPNSEKLHFTRMKNNLKEKYYSIGNRCVFLVIRSTLSLIMIKNSSFHFSLNANHTNKILTVLTTENSLKYLNILVFKVRH
jgi:hypothetical protein